MSSEHSRMCPSISCTSARVSLAGSALMAACTGRARARARARVGLGLGLGFGLGNPKLGFGFGFRVRVRVRVRVGVGVRVRVGHGRLDDAAALRVLEQLDHVAAQRARERRVRGGQRGELGDRVVAEGVLAQLEEVRLERLARLVRVRVRVRARVRIRVWVRVRV